MSTLAPQSRSGLLAPTLPSSPTSIPWLGLVAVLIGAFISTLNGRLSTFDLAGRVYKNKPAPDNLEVPPYMYLSDSKIVIGEDKEKILTLIPAYVALWLQSFAESARNSP